MGRFPDHRHQGSAPLPAHLAADAAAAGDHHDPVFRDLRQPGGQPHRRDGRLRLHAVHRARPDHDERDPEQLRQRGQFVFLHQVPALHRGDAGVAHVAVRDSVRLRGGRHGARHHGGRHRHHGESVLHRSRRAARLDHPAGGGDDLGAVRPGRTGMVYSLTLPNTFNSVRTLSYDDCSAGASRPTNRSATTAFVIRR